MMPTVLLAALVLILVSCSGSDGGDSTRGSDIIVGKEMQCDHVVDGDLRPYRGQYWCTIGDLHESKEITSLGGQIIVANRRWHLVIRTSLGTAYEVVVSGDTEKQVGDQWH